MFQVRAQYRLIAHSEQLEAKVKKAAGRSHDRRSSDPVHVTLVWLTEEFEEAKDMKSRLSLVTDLCVTIRED